MLDIMEYLDYKKLFESYKELFAFDKKRFLELCHKEESNRDFELGDTKINLDEVFDEYDADDILNCMDSDDIADWSLCDSYIRSKVLRCSDELEYYIVLKNNEKLQDMLKKVLSNIDNEKKAEKA